MLGRDEVGEVLLQAWALNGAEYVFFNTGSDIVWCQEGALKLAANGRPTPRVLAHLHEFVALTAASGYAMASGKPAVTLVHAELGTLNYGGAIHNAWHAELPILIGAGRIPTAPGGTRRGDRDQWSFWSGDLPDYGTFVRPYVKWDYELRAADSAGLIASRAFQVMAAPPAGPAYLAIPRDVALTAPSISSFPAARALGIPTLGGADEEAVLETARLLLEACEPIVIAGTSGRDPAAVAALERLCSQLALPFAPARSERMNLPADHPMYGAGVALSDADAVLVVDCKVPWLPGVLEPRRAARVTMIGADPAWQHALFHEFPADVRLAGATARVLDQITEATTRLMTSSQRAEIEARRARAAERRQRQERQTQESATSSGDGISGAVLSAALGRLVQRHGAVLLDDAVGNSPNVHAQARPTGIGSYFRAGGAAGGWGPGAAFGMALARPGGLVVLASGDGFFLYGIPNLALWSAVKYRAPFLTVIYENGSLGTGTERLRHFYPGGVSVRTGNFEAGWIEPAIDYVKLAESAGAWGERVMEAAQLDATLERAAGMVAQGVPAVVSVPLPRVGRDTWSRT